MFDAASSLSLLTLATLLVFVGTSRLGSGRPGTFYLLGGIALLAASLLGTHLPAGRWLWGAAAVSAPAAFLCAFDREAAWRWLLPLLAALGALVAGLASQLPAMTALLAAAAWFACAARLATRRRKEPLPAMWLLTPGFVTAGFASLARASELEIAAPVLLASVAWLCLSDLIRSHLQEQARTQSLARLDPLTGLFNRASFLALLDKELQRSQRGAVAFTVLAIGADNYRGLLGKKGLLAGERVLQHLAQLLGAGMRGQDLCARFSGEMLCVLLPDTTRAGAEVMAERLRSAVERACIGPESSRYTVSIGLASSDDKPLTPLEALEQAENAQHRARDAGGNRIEHYHSAGPGGGVE